MTAGKLREWRGVKPVAAPSGAAITTRLRLTPGDEAVLNEVAGLLGHLRRADLARVSHPKPFPPGIDPEAKRQERRRRLNARKTALTAQSSSRWAGTIIRGSDDQYRLARDAQYRHIAGLRKAIGTIEQRLVVTVADRTAPAEPKKRKGRRQQGQRPVKGYATLAERRSKQIRRQHMRAELARAEADRDAGVVHVTEGGKRLAKTRHDLNAAGLTLDGWREKWDLARWRIDANGSSDEPFGNLTITVAPGGQVSLRLPRPMEHLANAPRGRYVLSGQARFSYREGEWLARVTGGKSVSYSITRRPGRQGVYLTASWSVPAVPEAAGDVRAKGPVTAVDFNDGHLAIRHLDGHGNPVGTPVRIEFDITGSSGRRDAQVRHAITRLIHCAQDNGTGIICVEDLNFDDARTQGRETMGRGQRGKQFRRTVSGLPTAVFRTRMQGQATRNGIRLLAVNPAYTSAWGAEHWQAPYNVTRHEAAATVIGRRAQGFKARRRPGKPWAQPEDCAERTASQAGTAKPGVKTVSRHRNRKRGTESRPPDRDGPRLAGRATVTPAHIGRDDQLLM